MGSHLGVDNALRVGTWPILEAIRFWFLEQWLGCRCILL